MHLNIAFLHFVKHKHATFIKHATLNKHATFNLNQLNGIKSAKLVLTALFLALSTAPVLAIAATEAAPEWIYSVRPHDTLIQFGKRHLIHPNDWRILQKLNRIKDPYQMLVGSKIRVPLSLVKQGPASAEVILASGTAYILNADKSRRLVAVGQPLNVGDELQTSDKSNLNIRFADGSIVTIQTNSTMKLDTLSMYSGGGMVDTKLRLQQGKVEVEANPKKVRGNQMQIFTPTAVAAVRGTEFRVSADANSVRQETLDGQVQLSAAGEKVLVNKGYGSLSENGQAPQPPVELLPAPDVKSLPVKLTALPIIFTMPAQKDTVAWVGKIYKEARLNNVIAENVMAANESQTSDLNFGDLDDGRYYLQVRAKDSKGFEGYDATHMFTLKARPFAPQPVSPQQAETVSDAQPTFSWSVVDAAKTYLVELSKDAQFSHVLQTEQVAINQFTPNNALQIGEYFWRLASVNGDDIGPYSSVQHFKYKPKPPAPDMTQLVTKIENNRVYITTIEPPAGFVYEAMVDNEANHQVNVWHGNDLTGKFDYLLREYGKQTLRLRLVDADGSVGLEGKAQFDTKPQW